MTKLFEQNTEYRAGVLENVNNIDGATNESQAELAANRLRADFLKCSEHGMTKGSEGAKRWNAIAEDVYMNEKEGKGWDVKLSDKNNDGILEISLFDPKTGLNIYGMDIMPPTTKVINRADTSAKSAIHHAESSFDESRVFPEVKF